MVRDTSPTHSVNHRPKYDMLWHNLFPIQDYKAKYFWSRHHFPYHFFNCSQYPKISVLNVGYAPSDEYKITQNTYINIEEVLLECPKKKLRTTFILISSNCLHLRVFSLNNTWKLRKIINRKSNCTGEPILPPQRPIGSVNNTHQWYLNGMKRRLTFIECFNLQSTQSVDVLMCLAGNLPICVHHRLCVVDIVCYYHFLFSHCTGSSR